MAEGNDAEKMLQKLEKVWQRSLDKLKKISEEDWRWEVGYGGETGAG